MFKERFWAAVDKRRFLRILDMQDEHKKEFFDGVDGCGLEIEFGVVYEYRCRVYIETGLRKLKEFVGDRGKFVPDRSIGSYLNVEIVLKPFPREQLRDIFRGIRSIIMFYDNFTFDDNCGIHANFKADEDLKECFYDVLNDGRYETSRFSHNKYRADFMALCTKEDGTKRTYAEYLKLQQMVGAKYCGVNFLKKRLVEVRTLNLDWSDVEFCFDAYEDACALLEERQGGQQPA